MYCILVGWLEVLPLGLPVNATYKSSIGAIENPGKKPDLKSGVDSFEVKLGCLNEKEEAVYKHGKMRKKRFYHLKPLKINRPDWGVTEEKIQCDTCGRYFCVTVYSRAASRLKRLSALGFALLPLTLLGIFLLVNIRAHEFLGGFAIVIFLAVFWLIPVFLPVVFRKEHKLALRLQTEKGDRQHRFYETNVESVTQEMYYK